MSNIKYTTIDKNAIINGCRSHARDCPLAVALPFTSYKDLTIGVWETRITFSNKSEDEYEHSQEIANWIGDYDEQLPVPEIMISVDLNNQFIDIEEHKSEAIYQAKE